MCLRRLRLSEEIVADFILKIVVHIETSDCERREENSEDDENGNDISDENHDASDCTN